MPIFKTSGQNNSSTYLVLHILYSFADECRSSLGVLNLFCEISTLLTWTNCCHTEPLCSFSPPSAIRRPLYIFCLIFGNLWRVSSISSPEFPKGYLLIIFWKAFVKIIVMFYHVIILRADKNIKTTQDQTVKHAFDMLLGINHIMNFSTDYKLSWNGRNAACFIQLVMTITSLWGIWFGIPVNHIGF